MPAFLEQVFNDALAAHKNILVVGGTGSGKTTFVNALIKSLSEICPTDRLLILEDTLELQSASENVEFLRTSLTVDLLMLLKICMRKRPDRIIIGEARGGEALSLLKAWNTGHPGGIATIHANSAFEGIERLEELIAEATPASKARLIGSGIDMIIYIERAPGIGRRIKEVITVNRYNQIEQRYVTKTIYNLDKSSELLHH